MSNQIWLSSFSGSVLPGIPGIAGWALSAVRADHMKLIELQSGPSPSALSSANCVEELEKMTYLALPDQIIYRRLGARR
jgi:hypothetical protein